MTSSCTATYAALIFSVLVFGLVIRKRFYPVYYDTLQNLHRRSAFITSFDDLEQNMTKTSVSFIYKSCDKKPRQLCREHGIDQIFFPSFSIHSAQITNHVEFYGFVFFFIESTFEAEITNIFQCCWTRKYDRMFLVNYT
jgi:hypothetical protein